jgi:hypothetical protein
MTSSSLDPRTSRPTTPATSVLFLPRAFDHCPEKAVSCAGTRCSRFRASLARSAQANAEGAPRRILLRSSWQTVNIGDIAHTPGMLALLEPHLRLLELQRTGEHLALTCGDVLGPTITQGRYLAMVMALRNQ